jgi:peptidyl-prolyl cis-trans isomerase SurA
MKHLLLAVSLVFAAPLDRIIAVVDDQVILESELDEVTVYAFQSQNKAVPQGEEYQATRRTVLKSMIEDKLLVKYAELDSVTVSDDEVAAQREQQIDMFIKQVGSREALEAELQSKHGLTLSKLKKNLDDQIREQFLKGRLTEKLKFMYAPTRKEIERFFRDYRDSLPRQKSSVHLAHIMRKIEPSAAVVDSARKKIEAAAGRLSSGEGFAALVEAYSEDTVSAKNGGDLGFIEKGFLDKNIEQAAFTLNPGDISGVVRSRYGFHIIKTEERRDKAVRIRHILVFVRPDADDTLRTRAFLDSVSRVASTDSLFSVVAGMVSDDKITRHKGGDLGWVSQNNLSGAYQKAIADLSPGENGPPVVIDDACHVFRLLDRTDARGLTLDDDFAIIKELATNYRLKQEIGRICDRMRQKVYVENRLKK